MVLLAYQFIRYPIIPNNEPKNKKLSTILIPIIIKVALAQFALLGWVLLPKPQTNNIINPTIGMAIIIIVITHSPTDIGSIFCLPHNQKQTCTA